MALPLYVGTRLLVQGCPEMPHQHWFPYSGLSPRRLIACSLRLDRAMGRFNEEIWINALARYRTPRC